MNMTRLMIVVNTQRGANDIAAPNASAKVSGELRLLTIENIKPIAVANANRKANGTATSTNALTK